MASHSFGYECQKRSNLVVLDKTTVAFSAGNMVQFLDLSSMDQHILRSLGGGGVGALAVHPTRQYLAVGEKSTQPVIAIFTFPQLQLHRILRGTPHHLQLHTTPSKIIAALPNHLWLTCDCRRYRGGIQSHGFLWRGRSAGVCRWSP